MRSKAFTLAEVLLTLAIIGVVIAITIPALWHNRPNESMLMFKKAYYDAERVISDLINDEDYYPETSELNPDTNRLVRVPADFSNISRVTVGGSDYGDDESDLTLAARSKFCNLFAEKVNMAPTEPDQPTCGNQGFSDTTGDPFESQQPSFVTTNGIAWYIPIARPVLNGWMKIGVDINGPKEPDCQCTLAIANNQTLETVQEACRAAAQCPRGVDRFVIEVRSDGKMRPVQVGGGALEAQYLRNTSLK